MGKIIGHIGEITINSVKGWAAFLNACTERSKCDETPVEVKLFVNDKIVKSKLATEFRKGTKTKGIHPTGNCGFHFKLEGDQALKKNDKINVKAGKQNTELIGSPKIFVSEEIKEFQPKISENDKYRKKLFFMHIAKSAGTSLNTYIEAQYSSKRVYTHLESNKGWKSKNIVKDYDFLSGHIRIKVISRILDLSDYSIITLLREPLEHVISHISWARYIGEDEKSSFFLNHSKVIRDLSLKLKSFDFSEYDQLKYFVDNLDEYSRYLFDNCQTRYFLPDHIKGNITKEHASMALKAFNYFDLIGISEKYEQFIKLLNLKMNWKKTHTHNPRLNVQKNKYGLDSNDPKIKEILSPLIFADHVVYNEAKQLFFEICKSYKKELTKSNGLNFLYKGVLDNVRDGVIHGWAKKEGENDPVSIDIFINNKFVKTLKADRYRKDLEVKGVDLGKHAFSFDLTPYLIEEKQYTIRVKVSGTQYDLKKTPVEIDFKKPRGEMNIKKEVPVNKQIIAKNLINIGKKIISGWSSKNRQINSFNFINKNKKIIMGWSPKAGCTVANKMFFESAGCLEEALSYDSWIHNYNPIYTNQNPVTLRDMQRTDFYKFKIVRNPFTRVVSSYAHAMFYKYAEDDIKSVLKIDNPNNITFLQFLNYLGKIDLLGTNPHHGLQKSVKSGEGTHYKYDYICKLESLEEGIKEINKNSMADFKLGKNILGSHHYDTKIMSFNDSAYDKPFIEISSMKEGIKKVPDFKFFYNKEIIKRVSELYKEDISEYDYSYDLER